MKPKSEAWVKQQVKKIFAEFGVPKPYMPPAPMYGRKGAADFIECMWGRYVAVETKKLGNKQTPLQREFEGKIIKQGGAYILVTELSLDWLRTFLISMKQEYDRI